MTNLQSLLETKEAMPLGACLGWRSDLISLHVASDVIIAVSFLSIPIVLAVFVSRRSDLAFGWVAWAFVVFLAACGAAHLLDIWTIWRADFGAEGIVKAVTAVTALATAIALWLLLPKALALPSAGELRRAVEALRQQIRERDLALKALEREREERRRAEEMLRQAQKMEAIGQLTAGIAHDFNNLMTAVIGNLERARRLLPQEGCRQLARAIRGAALGAERAGVLTHRLLAFGCRQPLAPNVMNVNDVLEHLADTLRRTLGGNIRVVSNLTFDLWPTRVDADALESAILNLAVNARDAMPEGGNLVITTRNVAAADPLVAQLGLAAADFIEIAVADTGIGMSEEVASRAFEPFFTTKPLGVGSGLGLSQAYGFAVQSHGTAVLDSTAGHGTTVKLYLPRAQIAATPSFSRSFAPGLLTKAAACP
ncbi:MULTISPECIES: ATP-binding protein [Rhodoplanes]|uniref:histidine kinase n=1 Tax=Rhodoplanes serenus TaxID=200615 RepID=A0A327K331_9BRAD|nr:ATP-binding protein [Rhodoplanes serenus]MBI5113302.1 ATPase [Rhodovulum sp.]RAI32115.1 ATPase [Rhodoplanes serenus]VCU10566.1 Sensor kinase CckA [Rhodoplanes serenus]